MSALGARALWFVNRLRCMSAGEVLYRFQQAVLTRMVRHGLLAREAPAPQAAQRPAAPALAPAGLDAAPYLHDADAIVAGEVILFAATVFQVGPAPRWNRDPLTGVTGPDVFGPGIGITDRALVGDIKHVWELNRHLHLVRLAQAYALSGERRYADALAGQIASWLEQCPPLRGPNWTSSLELGIRLINWSLIWQLTGGADGALFGGAAGASLRRDWLASIFAHCQYIQRHFSRHSSANNHLVGELAGLYVAAQTWPCWKHSEQWRAQAKRELEAEAVKQHSSDGVNREQAFSYQVFTAEFLLLAGVAGCRAGDPFSTAYWQVLRRALHFLGAVRDVGGHVPMVGDADDGIVFRLEPGATADRPAMLLALAAAIFGAAPGARSATAQWLLAGLGQVAPASAQPPASDWNFADGGYLLFGSGFGAADEIKGMLDCGALGYLGIAAHGHADALALTLSVGGEECLVDPGTYSYWQDIQWRDYFRGTSAHNTLRVDRCDQSVSGGRFMWTRKAACHIERMPTGPAQFDFAGWHDGYTRLADPVRHQRAVQFDAATRSLLVRDHIVARQGHLLEQFWHFAPGLEVTLDGAEVRVQGRAFSLVGSFSGAALSLELLRGAEDPPLGWFSRTYESKAPCPVLRVTTQQSAGPIEARFTIDVF
ncbi:hypothetical protein ACFDR9_001290 [Janthinobacterium sp. CG_23.3]|uniref:heparinase II/III family protein n=1 Tax=Janthinobacterium sp. CG_23.3 TaxID=3349634 RepID=UPI0038D3D3BE